MVSKKRAAVGLTILVLYEISVVGKKLGDNEQPKRSRMTILNLLRTVG